MARARKSDNRAKSSSTSTRARPRRAAPDVERAMLELARRVAAIAAEPPPAPTTLRAALAHMLTTHASHAPALLDAWKRARTDKRAALALGWAREQLRLAVVELLGRETKAGSLRTDVPHDALAWVVVVASESAVAGSPAAGERIDVVMAVLGAAPPAC